MLPKDRLVSLRDAMQRDLDDNLLPFWLERVLDEHRGFHGFVSDRGVVDPRAPLGAVLCARLLWTFSAALAASGQERYRRAARHFHELLETRFVDHEHGGVFWIELVCLLDQLARLGEAGGAIGQGVAEGIQGHGVVRLAGQNKT